MTSYSRARRKSVARDERQAFGEELLAALGGNAFYEEDRRFDSYQGFEIILPGHMNPDKPYVIVKRTGSVAYTADMKDAKPLDML